jgi:hypothetical protein
MTLTTDIQTACSVLPQLDYDSRYRLINRILEQLEAYRAIALQNVPPERRIWIDTLVASVRATRQDIALMETTELLCVLVEFEKLLGALDELVQSRTHCATLH